MSVILNIDFKHNDTAYRLAMNCYGTVGNYNGPGLGCHISIVSSLGVVTLSSISVADKVQGLDWCGKMVEHDGAYKPMLKDYWGQNPSINPVLQERFGKNPEELKDLIYSAMGDQWKNSGSLLFSEPVNRGTKSRGGPGTAPFSIFPQLTFGPAPFAKWLSKHPEWGQVFATPVYANPSHGTRGDYSLVQVFFWIPKNNAWSIATDVSEVNSVPKDERFVFDNLIERYAQRFELSKEVAKQELKVTYA